MCGNMAEGRMWNIEKLNGSNYETWKFEMKMVLIREELWAVVEDELPAESSQTGAWKTKNMKALSTIALCVEKSQFPLIKKCESAKDSWKKLEEFHVQRTAGSKMYWLKKVFTKKMQPGQDVNSFLLEFDELFDRLANYDDCELNEICKAAILLGSLHESYEMLTMALESRPESELSLNLVKQKILDEAKRKKEVAASKEMGRLNFAMHSSQISPKCWQCNKVGHKKTECPELSGNESDSDSSVKSKKKKSKKPIASSAIVSNSNAYAMMTFVNEPGKVKPQIDRIERDSSSDVGNKLGGCKDNKWIVVGKKNWKCFGCKYSNFETRIQCRKCCGYKNRKWKRASDIQEEFLSSGGVIPKAYHM